jgi:hypothetical protein
MLANKYQDYMFDLIKKVIDKIGPRAEQWAEKPPQKPLHNGSVEVIRS